MHAQQCIQPGIDYCNQQLASTLQHMQSSKPQAPPSLQNAITLLALSFLISSMQHPICKQGGICGLQVCTVLVASFMKKETVQICI